MAKSNKTEYVQPDTKKFMLKIAPTPKQVIEMNICRDLNSAYNIINNCFDEKGVAQGFIGDSAEGKSWFWCVNTGFCLEPTLLIEVD